VKADLVVKNKDDTRRARVYKHESGEGWDFDLFKKHAFGGGWTVEAAWLTSSGESPARTRKEALSWVEDRIGSYTAVIGAETVTEGWPEKEPPKPTKDAAVEIRRGQVWRQGSRRLIVQWMKPHWNKARCPGEYEVGYTWIDPTGRETGRAIVGRRHEQAAHEGAFRAKFRFVCQPEDAREHGLKIEEN
jgi:hypothetical protein